jgi:hypothetical protein
MRCSGAALCVEQLIEELVRNLDTFRGAINLACRVVEDAERRTSR